MGTFANSEGPDKILQNAPNHLCFNEKIFME